MGRYVRICGKCSGMVEVEKDFCECGNNVAIEIPIFIEDDKADKENNKAALDIALFENNAGANEQVQNKSAEIKRAQVCTQCGTINYLKDGVQSNDECCGCGDTGIYFAPVEYFGNEKARGEGRFKIGSGDSGNAGGFGDSGESGGSGYSGRDIDDVKKRNKNNNQNDQAPEKKKAYVIFIKTGKKLQMEEAGSAIGRTRLFADELEDYPTVSREHVWIQYSEATGEWLINHVGKNSVKVNDMYIEKNVLTPLADGDIFCLSSARFKFVLE